MMEDFGERIDRVKRELGLKKQEIAEKLGVSRTMLYHYEKGEHDPPKDVLVNLVKLEKTFNFNYDEGDDNSTFVNIIRDNEECFLAQTVPLFNWSDVADLPAALENGSSEFIATGCSDPEAFAVVLPQMESMEPKFFAGDIIVVAPGMDAKNANPALCKFVDETVEFCQVDRWLKGDPKKAKGDETVTLMPVNHRWPPKTYQEKDFEWIYPVWEMIRRLH